MTKAGGFRKNSPHWWVMLPLADLLERLTAHHLKIEVMPVLPPTSPSKLLTKHESKLK
jgi:hypothetical protein